MIPHDPALDGVIGRQVWRPLLTAAFLSPDGASVPALAIREPSGTYTADAARWPRVECEIDLPTSLTPDRTASPVSPWGGTLVLDVGVEFAGVARTFRLATLDVTETRIVRPDGRITVKAVSHEARVDEDRFTTPIASPGGTATALITALVRRTLGATHPVVNRVPPPQDTVYPAREFTYDGGPWELIESISDAAGIEAWFDHAGALILAPTPVKGAPVITYRTGDGGTITAYESLRGWAPNRVAVVYEDQNGTRVTGLWEDTDPASATRVTGPYGRHTENTTVPVTRPARLPSQATANAAAADRARRLAARYRSIFLRTIPAPWIEPGDTVAVDLLGGLSETLLVGRHEFPLSGLDVATIEALDDTYTRDLGVIGRRGPGE